MQSFLRPVPPLASLPTGHRASWLNLAKAGATVDQCMLIKHVPRDVAKRKLAYAQVVLAVPVGQRLQWHLKKTVADDLHVKLRRVKDASECPRSLCIESGLQTLRETALPNLPTVEYYGVNEALDYSKAA